MKWSHHMHAGSTILHICILACRKDPRHWIPILDYLIKQGASVNARDDQGATPLYRAVEWGISDIVRYLLDHGADPTIFDNTGKAPIDLLHENISPVCSIPMQVREIEAQIVRWEANQWAMAEARAQTLELEIEDPVKVEV
jgi:ankyrin repeat protein